MDADKFVLNGYTFRRDESGEWWVNRDAPVWESMGKGDCANVALIEAHLRCAPEPPKEGSDGAK